MLDLVLYRSIHSSFFTGASLQGVVDVAIKYDPYFFCTGWFFLYNPENASANC